MNKPAAKLSRREMLRRTALLLGVSAVSPAIASAVMAGARADAKAAPKVLSADQLLLVAILTEMILPATDTPGANAVGVHHYIDLLLSDYFTAAHRAHFLQGLTEVDQRARGRGFDRFALADTETQHAIARELDREAYAVPEGAPASTPFFRELKELTLTGYYTSQEGATVELVYQPMPGHYLGCVPFKNIGRAWATF